MARWHFFTRRGAGTRVGCSYQISSGAETGFRFPYLLCEFQHTIRVAVLSVVCIMLAEVVKAHETTEVERELLAAHQSIGQMVVEIETRLFMERRKTIERSKLRIWQDGASRRCDKRREVLDASEKRIGEPQRMASLETADHLVCWNSNPTKPDAQTAAYWERRTVENLQAYDGSLSFDVRLLGVCPSGTCVMRNTPMDVVVGSANRTAPADVVVTGALTTVTYTRPSGTKATQVFSLRGGTHVLDRVKLESERGSLTMAARYPEAPTSGFYIPEHIEVIQTSGDTTDYHEQTEIAVVSINDPISKRQHFAIEAMQLPPGTWVVGGAIPPSLEKPGHHVEWDGKELKLVPNQAKNAALSVRTSGSPLPVSGRRRSEFGWLVAGSLLLLGSAVAFWVWRQHTGKK
jgi:hypothetical protein